ncbi:nuclear transport factor 2 family protein [Streptomyces sp. F63]|uniref:nuclear transport factor 2 family protein n=1 Tax=Streptomyces sp. F63 TaxID=2824887 RepID=UPI001B36EC92|nr:nuclear transport factor 2 family protein [Streptomyces sp. F63]MBQ0988403.1 nuclear transport factor 2 family protein [Streptomyces sp. F63]
MSAEQDAVAEAIAGELQLLDPDVRRSRQRAERLLDPEFSEVGASGRRWDRQETLAALPGMSGGPGGGSFEPRPEGMTGVILAPGLVHLTYETRRGGQRVRRSSIWRQRDGSSGWRMYYHQATPVPGRPGQPPVR